jgi:cytosine/adenosine deaminase-related metal-dependent hydrolase
LAGNNALEMGEEVALLRASHPELSPGLAFEMATQASAVALGLAGEVGSLEEGAFGDMVLYEGGVEDLERITSRGAAVQRVWVGGVEWSL